MSTANPHHEGESSVKFKISEGQQKRMVIEPKKLSIVWGKDKRYWDVPDKGPAELYQVSWLEVTGCVSDTDPGKEYEVGFNISLTPDAFGWSGSPVYILVKRGKTGKFKGHKFMIDNIAKGSEPFDIKAKTTTVASNADDNSNVYFGLYEVWRGKWKGGLKIIHAFIQEV